MSAGRVFLVGAGPGDPGLITVRGAEVLSRADVVVHDRLTNPALLALAPAGAERVDVGKQPDDRGDQEAINRLLVERAQAGLQVVRLKGGDPFVFGRGGEEALALAGAGVAFEVVPGVSSAVAAPAYAGVPVTHRGLVTSFTVVAGHSRSVDLAPGQGGTNWEALAATGGTIVVLMGAAHRARIAQRLISGGLPETTPVAAVQWGTEGRQRTVRTTLGELGQTQIEAPVAMVIGAVAALDLRWFEDRPLFGRSVVVTRSADQAGDLVKCLRELGADVVEVPVIAIEGPASSGAALRQGVGGLEEGCYDWVAFTSANAVHRFFDFVPDARRLGRARVAAVGPSTAQALASYRVVADLVPAEHRAEALARAFPPGPGTVLLPQAAEANPALPTGLEAKGWRVDTVEAYRTVPAPVPAEVLARAGKADAICFASPSAVGSFLGQAGTSAIPALVVCIGPVTAARARQGGLTVAAQAPSHDLGGLVTALLSAMGQPGASGRAHQ